MIQRFALIFTLVGLTLQRIPAHAQFRYPPAVTPEEQLAELGELLATFDLRKENGALTCNDSFSIDGKLTPETQMVCERQLERIALWRERHTKLCKELQVQGGKYGCK